jgi:hypothetical protein
MAVIDEQGRPEAPSDAGETETLLGFLEFQRATLGWKTAGLDHRGMTATVGVSTMTLGGLLKHMSLVEDWWFSCWLQGRDLGHLWDAADRGDDEDWDWHSAAADTPEFLVELWQQSVDRSRQAVAEALSGGDMGRPAARADDDGRSPSLRWIVCHMVEEYARHNGHADLLRESVDGQTGE